MAPRSTTSATSIPAIPARSRQRTPTARLAFEQLTLLVKESEGGQDLARDDGLLTMLVDIIVQCKRVDGKFRVTEVYDEPRTRLPLTS